MKYGTPALKNIHHVTHHSAQNKTCSAHDSICQSSMFCRISAISVLQSLIHVHFHVLPPPLPCGFCHLFSWMAITSLWPKCVTSLSYPTLSPSPHHSTFVFKISQTSCLIYSHRPQNLTPFSSPSLLLHLYLSSSLTSFPPFDRQKKLTWWKRWVRL